jgi:hypothetical protein
VVAALAERAEAAYTGHAKEGPLFELYGLQNIQRINIDREFDSCWGPDGRQNIPQHLVQGGGTG